METQKNVILAQSGITSGKNYIGDPILCEGSTLYVKHENDKFYLRKGALNNFETISKDGNGNSQVKLIWDNGASMLTFLESDYYVKLNASMF